ncbi:hypothetical protein CR205_12330 [Alteribacter lacisalsi]|uniref:Uncharacterized protein n=1 Tax=Alteribacter lacisalsi TaxID=2045244 RepID=A0A2W0HSD6_9BACI|nr:hypothetical protein [Alteribacter lacisalsi]PYZ96498.1 hypothetical protein CR205_12330 [Alteribacter lacisalsi]
MEMAVVIIFAVLIAGLSLKRKKKSAATMKGEYLAAVAGVSVIIIISLVFPPGENSWFTPAAFALLIILILRYRYDLMKERRKTAAGPQGEDR